MQLNEEREIFAFMSFSETSCPEKSRFASREHLDLRIGLDSIIDLEEHATESMLNTTTKTLTSARSFSPIS